MGPETLAAWTGTAKHGKRLLRVPAIRRHQVGDAEATVIFQPDSGTQEEVFRLLKPCCRRWIRSPRVLEALEAGRRRLSESGFKAGKTKELVASLGGISARKHRVKPPAAPAVVEEPSRAP